MDDDGLLDLPKENNSTWGRWVCPLGVCLMGFTRKRREEMHRDLDLESTVAALLDSFPSESGLSADVLDKSSKLLQQQRQLENTRARKRLEKWATKLITKYLAVVGLLIVSNAAARIYFQLKDGPITDTVMTVILSTTTVNIIGLGIIVLKGHFERENKKT